jgi:hypothetical protein
VTSVQSVCPDFLVETVFQVFQVPKVLKVFGAKPVATVPLVTPVLMVNQAFQVCQAPTVFQVDKVCQVKAQLLSLMPKFY